MQVIECLLEIFWRFGGKPTITSTPIAQCGIIALIAFTRSVYNAVLYLLRINPNILSHPLCKGI